MISRQSYSIIAFMLVMLVSGCAPPYTFGSLDRSLFDEVYTLANRGNPEAQYFLGMMFNNGIGTEKNPRTAFEWFKKSAAAGDPLASYKLGCYYAGQFNVVPIDSAMAFKYKLIAAESGYSLAQYEVAMAYFNKKEFAEAIQWTERSAKQGYAIALYNLGYFYKDGQHVSVDNTLAYAYFKLAKLVSEKRINEKAQLTLDEKKSTMSQAEFEGAEKFVAEWKAEPSPLTIRADAGAEMAVMLVKACAKNACKLPEQKSKAMP